MQWSILVLSSLVVIPWSKQSSISVQSFRLTSRPIGWRNFVHSSCYSAILFHSYSTIHITPEEGSSYVSFETNQKVGSYKALISNVIRTFRPKRFVMTLMADEGGLKKIKENPLTDSSFDAQIVVPPGNKVAGVTKLPLSYKRRSTASIKVEDDCCCLMGNWVLDSKTSSSVHALRASKLRGMSVS